MSALDLLAIGRSLAAAGRELEITDRPGAHLDPCFRDAEERWWLLVQATSAAPAADLAGAALQIASAFQLLDELVGMMMPDDPAGQAKLSERKRAIDRLLVSALRMLERDAEANGVDLEAIGLTDWLRSPQSDPWRPN